MKNHQINFRVSEETYHLLKKYADAYDIDVATYAKICCIDITSGAWLLSSGDSDTDGNLNTRQINFRVSEETYESIREAAEDYEKSVIQFVKACCVQTANNRTVPACTVRAVQMNRRGCRMPMRSQ